MSSPELHEYKSHKIVHARPMTDREYSNYFTDVDMTLAALDNVETVMSRPKSWMSVPQLGYLVVYQEGEPDQYESWCPALTFEAGNSRTPSTWQEVVEQDFEDLDANLLKLLEFMGSEEFATLDVISQRLMQLQQSAMLQYGGSLQDRLDYDLTLLEDIAKAQAKIDALAAQLTDPNTPAANEIAEKILRVDAGHGDTTEEATFVDGELSETLKERVDGADS